MKKCKIAANSSLILSLIIVLNSYNLLAQSKPQWVLEHPINVDYYIGIGYSNKSDGVNHVIEARNNALESISNEISVEIENRMTLELNERSSGEFDYFFESKTQTFSSARLFGYELIDRFENSNEYWVYYKLSKRKYRSFKIIEANRVKEEVDNNIKLINKYLSSNDFVIAINLIITSLAILEENIDLLFYTNNTTDIDQISELINTTHQILRNIEIVFRHPSNKENLKYNEVISVQIINKKDSSGISQFPLNFEIEQKKSKYSVRKVSEKDGLIEFRLPSFLFNGDILDLRASISNDNSINCVSFPQTCRLINSVAQNDFVEHINIHPLNIFIKHEESRNFNEILEALSGYSIREDESEFYDFKIILNDYSEFIGTLYGIHSYKAWSSMRIYNHNNDLINSKTTNSIIARHTNRNVAKQSAISGSLDYLKQFLEDAIDEILL